VQKSRSCSVGKCRCRRVAAVALEKVQKSRSCSVGKWSSWSGREIQDRTRAAHSSTISSGSAARPFRIPCTNRRSGVPMLLTELPRWTNSRTRLSRFVAVCHSLVLSIFVRYTRHIASMVALADRRMCCSHSALLPS